MQRTTDFGGTRINVRTPGDQEQNQCKVSRYTGCNEWVACLASERIHLGTMFQKSLCHSKMAAEACCMKGVTVVPPTALWRHTGFQQCFHILKFSILCRNDQHHCKILVDQSISNWVCSGLRFSSIEAEMLLTTLFCILRLRTGFFIAHTT